MTTQADIDAQLENIKQVKTELLASVENVRAENAGLKVDLAVATEKCNTALAELDVERQNSASWKSRAEVAESALRLAQEVAAVLAKERDEAKAYGEELLKKIRNTPANKV